MSNNFNKYYDKGFIDFEGNFLSTVSLIAAIISFIGLILNYFNDFPTVLIIIPLVALIFYLTIYIISKKRKNKSIQKWILSVGTLIILNLLWFHNYGYRGPAPYFFAIIYGVLIYVWHEKELQLVTGIIIINVLIIFYLDLYYPHITEEYADRQHKVIDIYSGVFFYIGLSFLVIFRAKNSYINEYKKAKNAEMLKTAFLANMSHEIRTPLNAIVGFSNLLAESDLPLNKRFEYKELVEENNSYLLQLISDILDISKIESQQLIINKKAVNLNVLITNIYNSIVISQKKKFNPDIKFSLNLLPDDFTITTDETCVNQIITNLVDNAFKFTDKGEINIKLSISENNVVIEVSDTGIGIKEENIEKVFERFYRIDNNVSKNRDNSLYRGTGLGLYLSRKLAALLEGNLWAISKRGEGSVFFLTLPLKDYQLLLPKKSKKKSNSNKELMTKFAHLKIMVVEDDQFNQIYFIELFKRFKINITIAKSGEEAVEILNNNCDFDLIFLDIKLPGIDGFEVLSHIKSVDCKSLIVAQTANAMEGDERNCLNAGFDKYISKPIKKAIIQKVLEDYIKP